MFNHRLVVNKSLSRMTIGSNKQLIVLLSRKNLVDVNHIIMVVEVVRSCGSSLFDHPILV